MSEDELEARVEELATARFDDWVKRYHETEPGVQRLFQKLLCDRYDEVQRRAAILVEAATAAVQTPTESNIAAFDAAVAAMDLSVFPPDVED